MSEQLSGLMLFLRYAWACAEGKLKAREIGDREYYDLKCAVEGQVNSRIDLAVLLALCFPKAVRNLRDLAIARGLKMWSLETVKSYWRIFHGHLGDCAVRAGLVSSFSESLVELSPEEGGEMFRAINLYRFDLKVGERVFVHRGVIADVE